MSKKAKILIFNLPIRVDQFLVLKIFDECNIPRHKFQFLWLEILKQTDYFHFEHKLHMLINMVYSQMTTMGGIPYTLEDENEEIITASDVIEELISVTQIVHECLRLNSAFDNRGLIYNNLWFVDNYSIGFERLSTEDLSEKIGP